MYSTNSSTGQTRYCQFRNHGHINHYTVTFFDSAVLHHIGKFAHLCMQFFVSKGSVNIWIIRFPNQGCLICPCFQVPIQTIIRNIKFTSFVPADMCVIEVPIKCVIPLFKPVQTLSLFVPKSFWVIHRLLIHFQISGVVDPRFCFSRCRNFENLLLTHIFLLSGNYC